MVVNFLDSQVVALREQVLLQQSKSIPLKIEYVKILGMMILGQ